MNIRRVPTKILDLDAHTARRQLAELLGAVADAVIWCGRMEAGISWKNEGALLRKLKDEAERITGIALAEHL